MNTPSCSSASRVAGMEACTPAPTPAMAPWAHPSSASTGSGFVGLTGATGAVTASPRGLGPGALMCTHHPRVSRPGPARRHPQPWAQHPRSLWARTLLGLYSSSLLGPGQCREMARGPLCPCGGVAAAPAALFSGRKGPQEWGFPARQSLLPWVPLLCDAGHPACGHPA